MKAIVYEKYGTPDVLQLVKIEKPTPKANEVLIKVHASSVSVGDVRMRSFTVPRWQWLPARLYLGVFKPRRSILGMEIAGIIEAIGKDVTQFKVGDEVFASTFETNFGGYAEYKCMPEDGVLAIKPDTLNFDEAAAIVGGGITALRCLRKANIQPEQDVLIYGASGAVGTSAVQIASQYYGATVTGVCSTGNLDMVQALGANRVIDYTRADFAQDGSRYDVVFDAVAKYPARQAQQTLKQNGTYLNVHQDSDGIKDRSMAEDLLNLKTMIEDGKLRPVIDRCYPMEQIVEAHRYVDKGHKKGNVVIRITPHD